VTLVPGAGDAGWRSTGGADPLAGFSWEERNLLANTDRCLAQGIAIRDWWRAADATGNIPQRFELTRVFNRPDESYSFFATVPMPGGPLPVMGDVPWVFYDQPKGREVGRWEREVEEFALRYFMRISSYDLPQAVVAEDAPKVPPPLDLLSWCPKGFVTREGFGFQQLYYKLRGSGEIGRFPEAERYAIVDQREMASRYEWVVAKVQVFNFKLAFPLDPARPQVTLPLSAEVQYIIFSDAFVVDQIDPAPGLRGRFQFGYAMLRPRHDDSVLAYGPGQFDAGFQLFTFTVGADGTIRVRMPFVVNRPTRILDISLDPLDWSLRAAQALTLGRADRLLEPLHGALESLPWRPGGFDPVFTGIELANLLTLGLAGRLLCISKEQLEKLFLVFHFDQYYTMITGSLLTWRQVPDWLDPARIPEWVKTGRSS
jgi:hypothetical protein